MKPRKVRRRLRAARDGQRAVTIERAAGNELTGFVLDVNRRWVLLRTLYDLQPWGWTVVATHDVRRVRSGSRHRVAERSQQAAGAWPPASPPAPIDLSGTIRAVLTSARRSAPLVTFHTERVDAGVCYVGRPVRWGRRRFSWQDVTPSARWRRRTRSFRLADVTRVDLGGPYEASLARLAGNPPPPH